VSASCAGSPDAVTMTSTAAHRTGGSLRLRGASPPLVGNVPSIRPGLAATATNNKVSVRLGNG
jgi:hypothetical protein